jgi:hypothetical protein
VHGAPPLDEKTHALVRIAGLIAIDAAPELSLALGYDVAAGLEEFEVDSETRP